MLYIFKFPDIGEGVTEGKILEWFVKKGQKISEGDPVVKMETDKVVADIPSPRSGVIKNIFGKVGDTINVDDALVEIEIAGDEAGDEMEIKKKEVPVEEQGYGVIGHIEDATTDAFLPATGEGLENNADKVAATVKTKIMATPVARKMAKDLGLDINEITGTGPAGRVMKIDIQRAFSQKQGADSLSVKPIADRSISTQAVSIPSGGKTEELSQIRKTIAARMVESKFTAPHATSFEEVEISRLVEIREEIKERFSGDGIRITYMPFILKATALALKNHPKLNCHLDMKNNRVIYNDKYNIGIAIDTPDGLIVPVINNADTKSIVELAAELKDKSNRARQRKLTLDELRGNTFSVTNYGSIAGIYGAPIINYPDVAILGVGRIHKKPIVKNDQIVPGNILPLSLAVDHRIVDGADAARFLRELMEYLAEPVSMLLL